MTSETSIVSFAARSPDFTFVFVVAATIWHLRIAELVFKNLSCVNIISFSPKLQLIWLRLFGRMSQTDAHRKLALFCLTLHQMQLPCDKNQTFRILFCVNTISSSRVAGGGARA